MNFSSKRRKNLLGAGVLAAAALTFGVSQFAIGSDHGDTVEVVQKPGTDLTDLHIFPGADPNNVVLTMSVRPLIPAGQAANFSFDQDVLYQFKIDTSGDFVEDLVIQARFEGTGASQRVFVSGPVRPSRTGTTTVFEGGNRATGTINQPFTVDLGSAGANGTGTTSTGTTSTNPNNVAAANRMRVFAGVRSDPFFLDFEQLANILPDRAVPLGLKSPPENPNEPMAPGFRPPGQAQDFFANFNLLAFVVELPKARLGTGKIGVWMTTSVAR